MEGYSNGEVVIEDLTGTPYEGFGPTEWALEYIGLYGSIDGAHHKTWVLDQVARILKGTPVELTLASWSNGHREYRFETGKPSQAYLDWVKTQRGEYNEEEDYYEYRYDEGIAP